MRQISFSYPLFLADTPTHRYEISQDTEYGKGAIFNYRLRLPKGVTCTHCIIQWIYYTGESKKSDFLTDIINTTSSVSEFSEFCQFFMFSSEEVEVGESLINGNIERPKILLIIN